MPPVVLSACIAIAVLAVIALLLRWSTKYAENLEFATQAHDRFYAAAMRLIRDEQLPDSVLVVVENFARVAGKSRLARELLLDVLFGRGRPSKSKHEQLNRDLRSLTKSQEDALGEMVANALISSACSDLLLGSLYRRLMWTWVSTNGRKAALILSANSGSSG